MHCSIKFDQLLATAAAEDDAQRNVQSAYTKLTMYRGNAQLRYTLNFVQTHPSPKPY